MSQVARRIVREVHDEPHLEGRRITVRFAKQKVEDRDLNVADVYRALTYYHDHPEAMRTIERERDADVAEHEELTTNFSVHL